MAEGRGVAGDAPRLRTRPTMRVEHEPRVAARGRAAVVTAFRELAAGARTLAVECYQGVSIDHTASIVEEALPSWRVVRSREAFKSAEQIRGLVHPDVTDDPVFGYITRLHLNDYLDSSRIAEFRAGLEYSDEPIVVIGPGAASILGEPETIVYADMPRWEIQQRQRRGEVPSLGLDNADAGPKELYKHSFFVDWRVLDRHKLEVYPRADAILDTAEWDDPRLVDGDSLRTALQTLAGRPFEMAPFFDPGVWGGEWMRATFGLEPEALNYAWCFNCVPEENNIVLGIGDLEMQIPAINLVLFQTRRLLGDPVHARFGREFPIRFDFLDTMDGENLSFQVHPLTEYIQEHFGMHYTQDESYYLLDARPGSVVYLGLKEGVDPERMISDLQVAERGEAAFPAEEHVESWPVKKHDHVLIPAGTPHCSGQDSVVLEISATPYIFTFKLWDWGRVDLDGKPRPINIGHGVPNIQWDRTTEWVARNLIDRVEPVAHGDGWREERTGLHEREFIETRRHWFTKRVHHDTGGVEAGSVNVLNLVEGTQVIVESPLDAFPSFVVHYAETFVVPAAVGPYTVRPYGPSEGSECATIKAYVRH